MRTIDIAGLAAVLLARRCAGAAADVELIVNHNWSSPSEIAALKVLQKHLAEKGVQVEGLCRRRRTTRAPMSA